MKQLRALWQQADEIAKADESQLGLMDAQKGRLEAIATRIKNKQQTMKNLQQGQFLVNNPKSFDSLYEVRAQAITIRELNSLSEAGTIPALLVGLLSKGLRKVSINNKLSDDQLLDFCIEVVDEEPFCHLILEDFMLFAHRLAWNKLNVKLYERLDHQNLAALLSKYIEQKEAHFSQERDRAIKQAKLEHSKIDADMATNLSKALSRAKTKASGWSNRHQQAAKATAHEKDEAYHRLVYQTLSAEFRETNTELDYITHKMNNYESNF